MLLIESLEYLTDDFQFNFYAKCRSSPFHAFFPDRKWWARNRKWRPFGVDWVPLVIKSLHRKMGSSNAFPVPDGTLGCLLHLCHVLDYVFSIFHFYCPACRTTLVATRFRVAVICPIIQVPHCIRVFFYFVWFVFINHIFQFYYELCTYCNILDIYLS